MPQGSVMGPLLFLIFINDLPAYLGDIYTKLFADDTTMLFSASDAENCVKLCKSGIQKLIDWCESSRLYINWEKTFTMFCSNRRKPILIESITAGDITIKCVEKFCLLGIKLDNKLNFVEHASEIALSATRKMFALKRIFYLSQEVKIHFMKTFILPCFDFGLSLIIYFSCEAINIMAKAYYKCMFHILRLDFSELNQNELNKKLEAYNLSSFQTKVIVKLATFGFTIAYAGKAPAELQATFIYGSSRQRRVLRASSTLFLLPSRTKTSHGDRTFKNFYATLLNKHNRLRELFVSHSYSDLK